MIAATAFALLLAGAPLLPPPAPMAVGTVPDEPNAVVLPEAPTYQAIAADVDGDGTRELVRLVGADRGAIEIEVWTFADGAWRQVGSTVNAVPARPTGTQGGAVYAGAPARLLVRRVGGTERAMLVRQPRFDEPGLHISCCLVLDDIVIVNGTPALAPAADRHHSADAVLAIDMDGDGTDELLVTRGLPPLGDTTFPTDARVLRWDGERFSRQTATELGVGSGASPFVLGNSDGVPGDEAAFVGAQQRLHRISLRAGDVLVSEDGGPSVSDAMAVPLEGGRGVAVVRFAEGLTVRAWPRDEPMAEPLGLAEGGIGDLVGVVRVGGAPQLLAREPSADTIQRLALPRLRPVAGAIPLTPAARTLGAGPVTAYVGMLPGGGIDGEPAAIAGGQLLPFEGEPSPIVGEGASVIGSMPGVIPVGLVGPGREWVALWHRGLPAPVPDPAGGRLDAPVVQPGSGVSLAPLSSVLGGETDDGFLVPPLDGPIDVGREVVAGAAGFLALIDAPAGSRVYVGSGRPAPIGDVLIVPAGGSLDVAIGPPAESEPDLRFQAIVVVVTPAGHGYLAAWNVHILNGPPRLESRADTPFGSGSVVVSGRTDPSTDVTVDGRPAEVDELGRFRAELSVPPWPTAVEVVAIDRAGNRATAIVSAVGWFDYRGLPWVPIAVGLVAAAGVVLFLRVPRVKPQPRRADEEGVLEDLDPD